MAVTVTLAQLAVHLRLSDDPATAPTGAEAVVLGRVLASATAMVERYAPAAPEALQNEAAVRLCGWLYDSDPSGSNPGGPAAMKSSGAVALLAPYRVRRAGAIGGDPVASPAPTPGGPGVDAVARAAAATAQEAADAAQAEADVNTGFLSTFTARVRAVVEMVVPAWARQASPPSGTAGSVADGAVTTAKLADRAVTQPKIGLQAVGAREIETGAVRTGHLADNAVESAKIPSDAILSRHIAADQVTRGEMAADSVGGTELVAGAVSEDKLAAAVRTKLNARAAGLTQAQLVDLLQFDVVPGVIVGQSTDGQAADWLTDWRVWVSGGDTVGDVWMEMLLEGLSTLAAPAPSTPGASLNRHKLSATNIYNFTLSNTNRANLISGRSGRRQGRDIEVDLRFYDAASGGNLIDVKTVAVDWLPAPAAPSGGGGKPTFIKAYTGRSLQRRTWTAFGIDVSAYSLLLIEADNATTGGLDSVLVKKSWLPTSDTLTAPSGSVTRYMRFGTNNLLYFSVIGGQLRGYADGANYDGNFAAFRVWGYA